MKIIIGFDPGFGNSKGAYINGQINTVHLPSVVGIGNTELGLLNTGEFSRRRSKNTPDKVSFAGMTYLVGEHVANFARPIERMDFQRLADGPELRALFYATMYRLLGEGVHSNVQIIVGLPVEVMQDLQLARDTTRDLRKWMMSHHQFFVNELGMVLNVNRVEVMPQPTGAFFYWGMDKKGQWSGPEKALEETVAICDIGFNTVDLFALQKQVVARYTKGEKLGMRRASELLIDHIRQKANIILSLHEADQLLRQRNPELSTADGYLDLTAVCQQSRESVAAGVLQFTERVWGNAKQFRHVLFTGGGAKALRRQLVRHYPHGIVLPEAVTVNAAGLAKYGMRALNK